MDYALFLVWCAVAAVVIVVFCWEEKRVDELERKRIACLNDLFECFFIDAPGPRAGPDEIAQWFAKLLTSLYAKHQHLIQPLKGVMPYRKIFSFMIIALVLGVTLGFRKYVPAWLDICLFKVQSSEIHMTDIFSFVFLVLCTLSLYLTMIELKWVIVLKSQIENAAALRKNANNFKQ